MLPKFIVDFEERLDKYESTIEKLSALSVLQKRNLMFFLAHNTDKKLKKCKTNLKVYYFNRLRKVCCSRHRLHSLKNKTWEYLRNAFLMYGSEHTIYKEWGYIFIRRRQLFEGAKNCYKHIKELKEHVLQLCE